jgi:hypothetical protein
MSLVGKRARTAMQFRNGRNVREGYERGWGLQFGTLKQEILAESLFQEAWHAAGDRTVMSDGNCLNLYLLLTRYLKPYAHGDIIEFGSYRAGNAIFMAYIVQKLYPGMIVYALDTFGGMPPTDNAIDLHTAGDFGDANFEEIRRFVESRGVPNLKLVRGLFEDTAPAVLAKSRPIALAHIDADIKSACAYAYEAVRPRMLPGGYIVFDDALFSSCLGATEVVEDLVIRRDGLNSEQIYPQFVFRTNNAPSSS